ncbi:MAG: TrmB family transcriptional regulator [Thaumarchaeota archaeon]|nr:TrmB family transcriptional regulator [Nitrososphaerota archaeon]
MMNDFLKSENTYVEKEHVTIFDSEPGSTSYKNRIAADRLREVLAEFGLSSNQSKIFIFLGKFGSKTAPEISKALRIPRTETYHIINTLQSKGIVTTEFISPARYTALPIEKALTSILNMEREKINSLSKQRKRAIELWNEVPSFFTEVNDEPREKLQVLQGSTSINIKITSMIRDSQKEFLMLGTEKDIARFYHADFFEILDHSTLKARFVICPAQKIPNFIEEADKAFIKVLPDGKTDTSCFILKDSSEALLFTKNASYHANDSAAVWTNSKSLIDSMQMLFNYCWEKAEIIF